MSPQTSPETVRRILDPRTPRTEVEQLLQSLSDAEKADLILRIAETARRKTLIVDIANKVSDSLSLDVLFPRLMEVVTETLDADRSSLFLHDPETGELFSRVMQGSVMGEVRFPAALGIAGSVFASGRAEIIADAYADSRFNREVDRRTGYRTRNILCVPIRNRKREVIGITQALNKRVGDFDAEDQQLLEALSQQAASALENARLFEKVERPQREEALLLEVVSSIASEIFLEPLLQKIIDAATQLLEADRGSLFLYDPAPGELYSHVAGGATIKEIRFPATPASPANASPPARRSIYRTLTPTRDSIRKSTSAPATGPATCCACPSPPSAAPGSASCRSSTRGPGPSIPATRNGSLHSARRLRYR